MPNIKIECHAGERGYSIQRPGVHERLIEEILHDAAHSDEIGHRFRLMSAG
jgi:hypothetical protein